MIAVNIYCDKYFFLAFLRSFHFFLNIGTTTTTEKRSNWNSIPQELLEKTVIEIDKDHNLFSCITTNKQWSAMVQPTSYIRYSIEKLDFSDRLFNNFINSAYDYGQVNHITLNQSLEAPDNIFNLYTSLNPLYLLMTCSPHVKTFSSLPIPWWFQKASFRAYRTTFISIPFETLSNCRMRLHRIRLNRSD